MEYLKKLSGHSGCIVDLCRDHGVLFVRKSAGTIDYNRRLKKQFIKQKHFNTKYAQTPKILQYGKIDNIFYFDMEFINGITLAEYMRNIKVKEIVDFMNMLFLSLEIDKQSTYVNSNDIFFKKICDLEKIITYENVMISNALTKLKNYDFSHIPKSDCCGDLTLENILITPTGKIYLIDLLDSFYNSWMIDVAKLLQDIDIGWSYRNTKMDYNLNLRLEIAKQSLIENILQLEDGKSLLISIYHILLLNILRIYPYTSDRDTLRFLDNAIEKTLNSIEQMEN